MEERLPRCAKPYHGNSDCSDAIGTSFTCVSISEKKLEFFKNVYRTCGCGSASSMMCDVDTLIILLSNAICPTCHCPSLSSPLKLHSGKSECLDKVLSFYVYVETCCVRLKSKCHAILRQWKLAHVLQSVNLKAVNFCASVYFSAC